MIHETRHGSNWGDKVGRLLTVLGAAAPFLVLGGLIAVVVWSRLRGAAVPRVPRRFWFGDLGSGWRGADGATPLPPEPVRPLDADPPRGSER
jgi:hypothetical protein